MLENFALGELYLLQEDHWGIKEVSTGAFMDRLEAETANPSVTQQAHV